jgi:isoleucyl-tRNA synthetase
MLGNLYDFAPETDSVPVGRMLEIDRFTLHKLQLLVEKARRAYDLYEYHTIYHALHNFCAIDLSALYLDILKDRLYTSPARSLERRSAQTVLYRLLDTLARIMAPILPFTAEEIWRHMPAVPNQAASIHLTLLPAPDATLMDGRLAERWERLLQVRAEVTKALEAARVRKLIGHALDACVILSANNTLYTELAPYAAELRSLFIVSAAELLKDAPLDGATESTDVKGLKIRIEPAAGRKCERCWVHETSVGESPEHPTICGRCRKALGEAA